MKKFEVRLQGENFLFNQDGEHRQYGFHARVFVRAKDPEEAAKIAVVRVRQSPLIREALVDESPARSEIRLKRIKKANPVRFLLTKQAIKIEFRPENEE